MSKTSDIKTVRARLAKICGVDNVKFDAASKAFFATDLYESGSEPDVIAAPQSAAQVCDIVKLARRAKRPVYVRGGGMSYSNAFQPKRKGAIMLDTRAMTHIRQINEDDLYVTVEAGCTWAALDTALKPLGLRAMFSGPYSGGTATIGGSLSQGTLNNSAAQIGSSASAVLSYEIVTGAGDLLITGMDAAAGHKPIMRDYGPDLTAVFSNDAGALGIKTAATLRLEPCPSAQGVCIFAFVSFDALVSASQTAAGTGLACAIIGMDAQTAGIRAGARGLKEDFKKLSQIVKAAPNPVTGLTRGAQIALAGSRVFERAQFTAHFLTEGESSAILTVKERALRTLVKPHGQEIPNAAISLMRANPFPDLPLTNMDGRRMLPIHGILPWSEVLKFQAAYDVLVDSYKAQMETANVVIADILSVVNRNSVLWEPVFYWPDSHSDYQREMSPDMFTQNWTVQDDNPRARALVEDMKTAIIDLYYARGAAHIQIGKQYPYLRGRSAENISFIKGLKEQLDPDNILNPGSLGLAL